MEPTRITCDGQRVTDVAAGSSHTLLCTARGRAFACGSNEHGQCGLTVDEMADVSFAASPVGSSSTTLLQPMVITALLGLRIVHVAAGFNHSMLRSRPGGILTCGGGDLGQCGNGETAAVNAPPGSVSGLDATPASAIACGNFHSVALSREDGTVYTWGEGRYGRLGHGTVEIALTPRIVSALLGVRISKIACGGACTACIDDTGGLWTWGSQTWGQCGHGGQSGGDVLEPRRVAALDGVPLLAVDGAEDHMLAVSSRGHVLAWGRACNGRLGSTVPYDLSSSPELLTTPAMAATAAAVASNHPSYKNGGGTAAPPSASTAILHVRLPYLDGLSGLGGTAGGYGEVADPSQPLRVTSVSCGGAHALLLCGTTNPDGGLPSKKRSKRRAVASRSFLEDASSALSGERGERGERGGRCRSVAGVPFTVQLVARDSRGLECNLLKDHQRWSVTLHGPTGAVASRPVVTDMGHGVFSIQICEERAGGYTLHAKLLDEVAAASESERRGAAWGGDEWLPGSPDGPDGTGGADGPDGTGGADDSGVRVSGSPASVMIAPADVDPARCTITGTCVSSATAVAGERSILHITPLDRFGNAIRRGAGLTPLPFEVVATPSAGLQGGSGRGGPEAAISAAISEGKDGTYQAVLVPRRAGRCAVFCRLRGEAVGDSPFFLEVLPGEAAVAACTVRGLQTDDERPCGEPIELIITSCDAHGNARPTGRDSFAVQVSGPTTFGVQVKPLDGGQYACSGTPTQPGKYFVAPLLQGKGGGERLPQTPIRFFATGQEVPDVTDAPPSPEDAPPPAPTAASGTAAPARTAQDDAQYDALQELLRGATLSLPPAAASAATSSPQTCLEGERLQLSVNINPAEGVDLLRAAVAHPQTLPRLSRLVRCTYTGADDGVAQLQGAAAAGEAISIVFECTPRNAGLLELSAALVDVAQAAPHACASGERSLSLQARVFGRIPWTFHQLGVLSTSNPSIRIPPLFYDVPPATRTQMCARPFGLLAELLDTPVDALPAVVLIDMATDVRLSRRLAEARLLLKMQPLESRPAMLALLVSSWLGGHCAASASGAASEVTSGAASASGAASEVASASPMSAEDEKARRAVLEEMDREDREWREAHRTNVRPLGSYRRGGQRIRALWFKLVFDEVIGPLASGLGGTCELRRARGGRLECYLHAEQQKGGGKLVDLFA